MSNLLDNELYSQEDSLEPEALTEESFDSTSMVDDLLLKNQEQSTNLTNQRQIINNAYKENKALMDEITALKEEINAMKSQQNFGYGIDKDTIDSLNQMKSQWEAMNIQRQREALVPILETMRDMGVPQQNTKAVFEQVKQIYGVDLTKNPNVNLMRYAIQEQGWGNTTSAYAPQGGYYNPQEQMARYKQAKEENYQAKLQAKLQEYQAYAQSKRQR